MIFIKKLLLVLATLLLGLTELNAFSNSLVPTTGSSSERLLTPAQDKELGEAFMRQIRHSALLVEDPLLNDYIQTLGGRLAAYSSQPKKTFHFFIVNDPTINAFAGPGGYIGVQSGLILATQSENELASVLAHEIAHVTQNHFARRLEEATQQNLASMGALLAAILLGSQTNAKVGSAAMQALLGANTQQALNFSRSQEQEADRMGIADLHAAGFDPNGMPHFFARMERLSFNTDPNHQIPEFLRTHPVTQSRIADAENRVNQYPPQTVASSTDYYLMWQRMQVANLARGQQNLSIYQDQLAQHKFPNQAAAEYGYALLLLKNNKLLAAKNQFQQLIEKDPQQVIYKMGLADEEIEANRPHNAVDILQKEMALYPHFYPLTVDYASALLSAHQPLLAQKTLRKEIRKYPEDTLLYSLLARAYGEEGNLADAYQARAQILDLSGYPRQALVQLRQAAKLPRLSEYDQLVINARMEALEKKVKRQHLDQRA